MRQDRIILRDPIESPFNTPEPKHMRLVVRELAAGWMVGGPDRSSGPFISRDQAMDLAEGMASAIRASGMPIDVVVEAASGQA